MICRCWIPTLLSRVHIVTAPCRRTGTILEVVLAGDWMGQGHFRSSPPYPTHQFWVLLGQGRPSMSYLIIVMPSTLVMVKTLGPRLLWFWPCYHILGLTGLWIRVWEMLFLGTLHGWREARKLPVCMTSPKKLLGWGRNLVEIRSQFSIWLISVLGVMIFTFINIWIHDACKSCPRSLVILRANAFPDTLGNKAFETKLILTWLEEDILLHGSQAGNLENSI